MCVPPSGWRQRHRGDQFARRQRGLDVRRVAGQAVEVGDRNGPRRRRRAAPSRPSASSARIATAMSLGCVAMQASLAPTTACWRLKPPIAAQPLPGWRLLQGMVGVVEIRAARALQQVARRRRLVAQLARGAGEQRARQHARSRGARARRRRGRCCAPARRCAARPRASARSCRAPRPLTSIRCVGVSISQLHQVEQVGAAGDELGARGARRGRRGFGGRSRALVGEGLHALPPGDFGDRLDDVGIGAAAADVAAHALADLGVGQLRRAPSGRRVTWLGMPASISSSTATAEQIWPGVQ